MKLNTKDETKYKYGEDIQDKNSFDTGWKILNKNCEHKKINKWINKKIKKHKQVNQPIKKKENNWNTTKEENSSNTNTRQEEKRGRSNLIID